MNFGKFENRLITELVKDPEFAQWMDPTSRTNPDGAEDRKAFYDRTNVMLMKLFEYQLRTHTEEAACITHGGVIMNMMANHVLPQHKPEEWMTDPGCGYSLRLTPKCGCATILPKPLTLCPTATWTVRKSNPVNTANINQMPPLFWQGRHFIFGFLLWVSLRFPRWLNPVRSGVPRRCRRRARCSRRFPPRAAKRQARQRRRHRPPGPPPHAGWRHHHRRCLPFRLHPAGPAGASFRAVWAWFSLSWASARGLSVLLCLFSSLSGFVRHGAVQQGRFFRQCLLVTVPVQQAQCLAIIAAPDGKKALAGIHIQRFTTGIGQLQRRCGIALGPLDGLPIRLLSGRCRCLRSGHTGGSRRHPLRRRKHTVQTHW